MSLDRRSRKFLLWNSRAANLIAIAMGVYMLLNWDIATYEDAGILIVFMAIGAVSKAFSI